jgi:hypothetical protein
MAMVVKRITAIGYSVYSVHIIDVSVCIVVDAISGNFKWIYPHISGKIGVCIINTGIDDQDQAACIAGGNVPRLRERHDCGSIERGVRGVIR